MSGKTGKILKGESRKEQERSKEQKNAFVCTQSKIMSRHEHCRNNEESAEDELKSLKSWTINIYKIIKINESLKIQNLHNIYIIYTYFLYM